MSAKLWGGRFAREMAPELLGFHSSLPFDRRLYREDIEGSIAHARMLGRCGILTAEEARRLEEGLRQILEDWEGGRLDLAGREAEDIHSLVESLLVERVGEVGKKLHTARSRNDQVALDLRLYLKRALAGIAGQLRELEEVLLRLAEEHREVVLPGYTHLQPAQPVLLAHHLLAYFEMFLRDLDRLGDCYRRADVSPLGAGALAGVTFPIDREMTARELGFAAVAANSMDAVSDRDFAVEFLAAAALIMAHLSRFCEELVLWSAAEFGFVELDDAYATGSSIMPQKKNPDVPELIRGKAGRVYGHLMALLTVLKGLPLTYNKDLQEDKEALFDTVDTLRGCLGIFIPLLATLRFNAAAMRAATARGFLNATDVADYLARRGMPFREAHALVGRLVRSCLEAGRTLEDLTLEEWRAYSPLFAEDILEAVKLERCLAARDVPGGTAPQRVAEALAQARRRLAELVAARPGLFPAGKS
ncbi:MAG: argininosuccinate lyase [Bacillota bacterium]|nr:argininosuccinate lyase [Bacillota bacterium]